MCRHCAEQITDSAPAPAPDPRCLLHRSKQESIQRHVNIQIKSHPFFTLMSLKKYTKHVNRHSCVSFSPQWGIK